MQVNFSAAISRMYVKKDTPNHIDGQASEQIIWLEVSLIECGTSSQITCSQALVLPSSMNDEIRLNLSATVSKTEVHCKKPFCFTYVCATVTLLKC